MADSEVHCFGMRPSGRFFWLVEKLINETVIATELVEMFVSMTKSNVYVVRKIEVVGTNRYLVVALGSNIVGAYEDCDQDICEAHVSRLALKYNCSVQCFEVGSLNQERDLDEAVEVARKMVKDELDVAIHCYYVNQDGEAYDRGERVTGTSRRDACTKLIKRSMGSKERILLFSGNDGVECELVEIADKEYGMLSTERGSVKIQCGSRAVIITRDWAGLHLDVLDSFTGERVANTFVGEGNDPRVLRGIG